MKEINKIAVGKKLRALRQCDGHTLQQVSDMMNLSSRGIVSKHERGLSLTISKISQYCVIYNYEFSEIIKLGIENTNQDNEFSLLIKATMIEKSIDKKSIINKGSFHDNTVSAWLNNQSFPKEKSVFILSEILDLDPLEIIKTIEKSQKTRFEY